MIIRKRDIFAIKNHIKQTEYLVQNVMYLKPKKNKSALQQLKNYLLSNMIRKKLP